MIRINCPYCGERDHSEFSYGGDASIKYPSLDSSEKEWTNAIFFRKNIKGFQLETWHHSNGCRMWLEVEHMKLKVLNHVILTCRKLLRISNEISSIKKLW